MVDPLGLAFGAFLTVVAVALHYLRGTSWTASEDVSAELLERRAETVTETEFPEPGSRSIGGAAGAPAPAPELDGADAEGELDEADADAEESAVAVPEGEEETFEIEYEKEGRTIEVANTETLLEAGEDEGWDLPYACREGQCVSCGGRVADGPAEEYVVHDDQQMLDEDELEDGYVLTCVAYPQASFTLETNETP